MNLKIQMKNRNLNNRQIRAKIEEIPLKLLTNQTMKPRKIVTTAFCF